MKAELNIKEASAEHTFPALYQALSSDGSLCEDLIVLAVDEKDGCRVCTDGTIDSLLCGWTPFTDPKEWRRLPAGTTITLTQEQSYGTVEKDQASHRTSDPCCTIVCFADNSVVRSVLCTNLLL